MPGTNDANDVSTRSEPLEEFHGIALQPENPEELFDIVKLLGKGTFGYVYLARNTNTDELVAAKQIPLVNDDELEVVRREAKILSLCDHHNVVRHRGTYRGLNALWITMEYCSGGSVDNIFNIVKRPMPEPVIAYICREVVKGLIYLHEMHKIHRDIKGGNILLTGNGDVKISDFGVSTELMHSMSRRNSFMGTLYWMAPEAIQEHEYDERADIWSLGITLIEIAEGKPPRIDMHYAVALLAIPKQAPPTLRSDNYSPVFQKFVARLLVKDPMLRPRAVDLLNDPFLSPASIGPDATQMLKEIINDCQERAATMTTARRLGEETSDSNATIVERPGSEGNSSAAGGDPLMTARALQPSGADLAPENGLDRDSALLSRYVAEGMLAPLPLLSTDEFDLDEMCAGYSDVSPLPPPPEDIVGALSEETGWEGSIQPRLPPYLTQATKALLASYVHHKEGVIRTRQVTLDEAERSAALTAKYGSVLKSTLRI